MRRVAKEAVLDTFTCPTHSLQADDADRDLPFAPELFAQLVTMAPPAPTLGKLL
jgi:hypothetical protein